MNRDLDALSIQTFDILVVGGGVLGACVARDAALRGLSVALVEKGDFASGTSCNSLKIVHGGLRYLQHLDLRRMRESIRERSMWLRIAPHLVEPLPVLIPSYRHGLQLRPLLRFATALSDAVGWDRNRDLLPDRRLAAASALSRRECLDLVPELERPDLTGGVLFHDAQMYNSERLVLEILLGAAEAGAVVANYVELEALRHCAELAVCQVRDVKADERFDIRARLLVNAAGPAAPALAAKITGRQEAAAIDYSVALNLMVPSLGHKVAFALARGPNDPHAVLRLRKRQLFVVPWRGRTLIGTAHSPYHGDSAVFRLAEADVTRFLEEVNSAWPAKKFTPDDVVLVHGGLLPIAGDSGGQHVNLLKRHRIIDHASQGLPQAVTGVGVKYTTARLVAQEIVDLATRKLEAEVRHSPASTTPLPGAPTEPFEILLSQARGRCEESLDDEVVRHLVLTYGARYDRILAYRGSLPDWNRRVAPEAPAILAQLVHAAREEMALYPEDLLDRRTEIGARGLQCADAKRSASEALTIAKRWPGGAVVRSRLG